ncbi:hypothetical protein [Krasilnikoviella flava]|uniref:DUF4126 domain-containing protein n=1 Tax=Krasilnikoviella flava TaxID=526729 RepID=A0A1T5LG54_9MICO|nr:hypothetical protein [Krasilnikoviella flava]SKC74675.1 hypothetical protein SAMN04324258_3316 [Krasilnikoviella flava]
MTAPLVVRALALGVAAGSRASLGVAAPLLGPVPAHRLPTHRLRRPAGMPRLLAGLAVAGELVGDKLPTAPSRLDSPGPQSRAASGALGGLLLARRHHVGPASTVAALVAGAAGGAAGTFTGAAWRSVVASRGWPDLPAALAEDVVALGLAAWATRA